MFELVLFAQQNEKIEIPIDTTLIDMMTNMIIKFGIITIVIVALMATTRICIDLLFKKLRRWLNERRVEREIEQVKTKIPICPLCNNEMVRKTMKSKKKKFLVCLDYPRCKGLISLDE